MHAAIDLDILCYEMGSAKEEDGLPLSWPLVQARIDDRIFRIIEATEATSWSGYLTGAGNFREHTATIKPYKGKRNRGERPFWYEAIYRYLQERGAEVVHGYEADDRLAMVCGCDDTILCSRDKDMLQVPGWHYQWPSWKQEEQSPFYLDELAGLKNFYTQLLIGDSADNILGLYNMGPKSAAVKRIKEGETELELFAEVKHQYELRFGTYWDMFMCENGRLLWLLRSEDDDWFQRQRDLQAHLDGSV